VNGIGIHADDYDDTQLAVAEDRVYGLLTHPTATALAAALATSEAAGRSGQELMSAYHAGVEVECKIAEAIAPRHYDEGFHSTGTCGAIGAAAAAAKVAGLNPAATRRALGIAASEAGGLRENFGTMTKPFHAGRAAESGVVAADLAKAGWTAAEQILRRRAVSSGPPGAPTILKPSCTGWATLGHFGRRVSPSNRFPRGLSPTPE